MALYVWPHCRFCSSQLVKLVLQVDTWPLEERAVAVYSRAPSAKSQSRRKVLVKQSRTPEAFLGVQGTARGRKIEEKSMTRSGVNTANEMMLFQLSYLI